MPARSTTDIIHSLQKIYRERLSGYVTWPMGNQPFTMIFWQGRLASFDDETLDLFFLPFLRKQRPADAPAMPASILSTDIPLLRHHLETVLSFLHTTLKDAIETATADPVSHEERPVVPPLQTEQLADIPEIILPLYSEKLAAPAILNLFPDFSAYVSLQSRGLETARNLKLTPQQGYVLSRIQSGCSLRELVMSTGLPEELVLRSLAIFLFFDCVHVQSSSGGKAIPPAAKEKSPTMEDLLTAPPPAPPSSRTSHPGGQDHTSRSASVTADRKDSPSSPAIEEDILLGNAPPAGPAEETFLTENPPEIVMEIDDLDLIAKRNNYYEILDVDRRADPDTIKKRFVELTKKYHPDIFQRYNDPALQSKVDHIFAKITEAWEILKDPVARASYDQRFQLNSAESVLTEKGHAAENGSLGQNSKMAYEDREHRAKQHFLHGKEDFKNKKYHDALEHFRESVRQMPNIAEYQFMLGKTLAMNPQRAREAEERLKFALDKQPKRIEFVLEMARFYHKNNLTHRAQRFYQQVLELNPNHDEARFMLGLKKSVGKRKKSGQPKSFKDYLKLDLKDIFKSEE